MNDNMTGQNKLFMVGTATAKQRGGRKKIGINAARTATEYSKGAVFAGVEKQIALTCNC